MWERPCTLLFLDLALKHEKGFMISEPSSSATPDTFPHASKLKWFKKLYILIMNII